MRLACLIASVGRNNQTRRARAAYLRESPASAQLLVCRGHDLRSAWERGLEDIQLRDFDLIHFGSDWLEPHPGWYLAARADSRRIASPVIWSEDGTPPEETLDWTPATWSPFPTLTPNQLRRYGVPPLGPGDEGLEFVIRAEYAFTALEPPQD